MPHITFIHGIANKPPEPELLDLWCRSLAAAGLDIGAEGVTCSMVYWADVMYATPLSGGASEESANEAVAESESPEIDGGPQLGVQEMSADEKLWTAKLAAKLAVPLAVDEVAAAVVDAVPTPVQETLERIPLPWPIKERIMKRLLRDVHHYLFNVDYSPRPGSTYKVQDEIRGRMIAALQAGAKAKGPHVVVSHSMGTVIAYDCLKRVGAAPMVDGLMTIGSPLGLDEIQDKMQPEWTRANGFPFEKVNGKWVNVYDRLDPVAGFDPSFANDYRRNDKPEVDDVNEQSYGSWRHDITKYLQGPQLRQKLRDLLKL
jgi:predicted alpha/beta hydrolase family esterase